MTNIVISSPCCRWVPSLDHASTLFSNRSANCSVPNNYGPPYGSAGETFAEILRKDFRDHRNELVMMGAFGARGIGQIGLAGVALAITAAVYTQLACGCAHCPCVSKIYLPHASENKKESQWQKRFSY